jgi:hypothetical protein
MFQTKILGRKSLAEHNYIGRYRSNLKIKLLRFFSFIVLLPYSNRAGWICTRSVGTGICECLGKQFKYYKTDLFPNLTTIKNDKKIVCFSYII